MSRFAANYRETAAASIMAQHGEPATYTPVSGSPRSIMAMVARGRLDGPLEFSGTTGQVLRVMVRDIAASTDDGMGGGISASEVNTGGDTLTIAADVGATPRAMRIASKIEQWAGMLVLELR